MSDEMGIVTPPMKTDLDEIDAAWNRLYLKNSPTYRGRLSDIVISESKLAPFGTDSDDVFFLFAWILNTNEEFYYQNTVDLISVNQKNSSVNYSVLRLNRIKENWSSRLKNFYEMGRGAFGVVYRATDTISKNTVALKGLRVKFDNADKNLSQALTILTEKNAYIRSNESNFIVKLFAAFQDSMEHSFWLVMEFCIGDLSKFLIFIDRELLLDAYVNNPVCRRLFAVIKSKVKLDLPYLAYICGFEIMSGLDYLSKRNLLHNDLKPDNILVSMRGHLKIADLGLTERVRWVERQAAQTLLKPSELQKEDVLNKSMFRGNRIYTDPELLIYNEFLAPKEYIYEKIKHKEFPITSASQNFLSDLYAGTMITMQILFAGNDFINIKSWSEKTAEKFDIDIESDYDADVWPIRVIYDQYVYEQFFLAILKKQKLPENEDLVTFIIDVMKPRSERGLNFTREIKSRCLGDIIESRCIDIETMEQLPFYKSQNITTYSVVNMEMPEAFLNLYKEKLSNNNKLAGEDFEDILEPEQGEKSILDLSCFGYSSLDVSSMFDI